MEEGVGCLLVPGVGTFERFMFLLLKHCTAIVTADDDVVNLFSRCQYHIFPLFNDGDSSM